MKAERLRGLAGALACAALLPGCAAPMHSAVLGPDQAELVEEQCSRPNPPHYDSTWQPGPEDVRRLEQDLPALDSLAPAGALPRVGDPAAYDRQYFGIQAQGRRLIYVNAFLEPMANKDWKHYAIVICDGGTGAWGALYDPASRSFSDFAFNGRYSR